MARGTQSETAAAGGNAQNTHEQRDCKLLITELMGFVLKPTKDKQMHSAYIDCFFMITKEFADS